MLNSNKPHNVSYACLRASWFGWLRVFYCKSQTLLPYSLKVCNLYAANYQQDQLFDWFCFLIVLSNTSSLGPRNLFDNLKDSKTFVGNTEWLCECVCVSLQKPEESFPHEASQTWPHAWCWFCRASAAGSPHIKGWVGWSLAVTNALGIHWN